MSEFVLYVRGQDVINYTISHDASRMMFLQGEVVDAIPSAAKGRIFRVAYTTKPLDIMPNKAWIGGHDDVGQANITVSEPFMDHLLTLIRDHGVRNLFIAVHGKADEKEIAGHKPEGIYEVTTYEVRHDGPAGQRS